MQSNIRYLICMSIKLFEFFRYDYILHVSLTLFSNFSENGEKVTKEVRIFILNLNCTQAFAYMLYLFQINKRSY